MTGPETPAPPEAITTGIARDAALPPPAPTGEEQTRAAPSRFFAGLLVGVALLFAFLAGSTVARNSDVWFHLATGRLLVNGDYQFGVDPFTYTAEGAYWVNQTWLYQLLLYLLFRLVGGAGLVVFKSLLVVALAAVLLLIRSPGSRLALPVLGTLLSVLAMSPQLLLQPACISFLFLALTLWLLWKQEEVPVTATGQVRRFAPLLVLFVLWVNLDSWFLLGPLLVGLFWLGSLLERQKPARIPAWLFPASLAVCVLNPHHVRVFFALPSALLALLETGFGQDARFRASFASPWRLLFLSERTWAIRDVNLAEAAYL